MLIGIAGTLGAGKGTVVEYLKTRGFVHYSVREFLWQEVDRRGLERVRDNLSVVANDLRSKYGPGYIIEEIYKQAVAQDGNIIIESLHTPGEATFLRDRGAYILGVDADIETRYKRIKLRGTETDHLSFAKFKEDNEREIASTDPSKHNILKVIGMADYVLTNNGTLEELHVQIDEFLQQHTLV